MKISVAQIQVIEGNIEKNYEASLSMIERAKQDGSSLVLFPELFLSGFDYTNLDKLSRLSPKYIDKLLEESKNIAICGTFLENIDNKIYNTFYCIYERKVLFKYSKVKLFEVTKEDYYFNAGNKNQPNTFDLFGIKFGVCICFELRFPEILRKAALNGAQVLLVSAIWPVERLHAWQSLSCARAIENQAFVVTCNANEASGRWMCAGHSSVYDPNGKMLECAYNQTGVKTVSIEPSLSKKIQREFPSLINAYDLGCMEGNV
ncbi:nitrilase-related carbon-nitrogen hydrolase [Desulfurella sp.]|uniref:nitrilase-related carbon-nitrogen hydrolase n=1 Tax=Desulfurella sp. TaxID=1962857 RepID=UPI003D118C48